MKTKILVLGSTGMLGHMVLKVLSKESAFEAHGTHLNNKKDHFYFDVITGLEKLSLIYNKGAGYNYFINCIGITKDKIDEKDKKFVRLAEKINAKFPHELADFAKQRGIRIIHISTDGIFSGIVGRYDEDSPCDSQDVYARTKRTGEVVSDNVLNIRCSIIGPSPFEKRGLFEWFYSQPDGSKIEGYTNHIWSGVSTLQFAELCSRIIKNNSFDALRKESPLFHFAPNRPVSKYELLKILKFKLDKNIIIVPIEHRDGPIKRILVSMYKGLKKIYPHDRSMEDVISELLVFINHNNIPFSSEIHSNKEH